MKTEISIPDSIFAAAQELAAKLGVSLSELYTRAVTDLVARYHGQKQDQKPDNEWEHLSDEEITARLNEVYEREPSYLDPVVAQLQAIAIGVEEW
jgi:hypothetical protein